jgi:hypothetical protein
MVSFELLDAIPLQPFDNLLRAIKALPDARQDLLVGIRLQRVAVRLKEELGRGVGRAPVSAVKSVLFRQADQQAGRLFKDVAIQSSDLFYYRLERRSVSETVRVCFLDLDLLSTSC